MRYEILKDGPAGIALETAKDVGYRASSGEITCAAGGSFALSMTGEMRVWWPNREGEVFDTKDVPARLSAAGVGEEGVSLVYPSTASCRTILVMMERGGILLAAPPDGAGRVSWLTVGFRENEVVIHVKSAPRLWHMRRISHHADAEKVLQELRTRPEWLPLRPTKPTPQRVLAQVGLIGPEGQSGVPSESGFSVLGQIARLLHQARGPENLIHVFGYAHGHDRLYPDYAPSPLLGGSAALENALATVHEWGQRVTLYMNARIADEQVVLSDSSLAQAALITPDGDVVREYYNGRSFLVMNPASQSWRNRLVSEARRLRSLGTDGVQLDQIGGRVAPAAPGDRWGDGYRTLIRDIQSLGLEVWIQGLSDFYPADWFELTYRRPTVSEDGTIRGGCPLGLATPLPYLLSVPGQTVLVPLSKVGALPDRAECSVIVDLEDEPGELFLYDPTYMIRLTQALNRLEIDTGLDEKSPNSRVAGDKKSIGGVL